MGFNSENGVHATLPRGGGNGDGKGRLLYTAVTGREMKFQERVRSQIGIWERGK